MRILLTNDDGIRAEGIRALVDALAEDHEVIVSAPQEEQSGMAHALTVKQRVPVAHDMMLENEYGITALSIGGTPTDCVKLYLEALAGAQKPDLVISGINHGANLGTDVLYSGTVGAAMEGFQHGIPSLAVSLDYRSEIAYEEAAALIAAKLSAYPVDQAASPFFYNINFPCSWQGRKPSFIFTQLGNRDYINAFQRYEAADGSIYYVMAGEMHDTGNSEATDIYAAEQGYASVTPLQIDLTDYLALEAKLGHSAV